MRFAALIAGVAAAVFLIPLFMQIWETLIPNLTSGITNPHVLLFYAIAPYAIIAVIVISAFIIIRRRTE